MGETHVFQGRKQAQRWLTPRCSSGGQAQPHTHLPCLGIYCFSFYLSWCLFLQELLSQVLKVLGISEDLGEIGMLCSKKCKLP